MAESVARACPKCGRRIAEQAVLCTSCGHDFRAHRRVGAQFADTVRQLAGRLGASPRLLGWIVGLVLAGILGVSLVAALRDSGAGPVYLGVVVTYVVVGWAAGFLSDLKQGSVLQALLWFAPFGGRWTTLFGVAHEVTSSRIHHRHPVLEAIFVNAVLAILSFVIVLVVRGLNLVSP